MSDYISKLDEIDKWLFDSFGILPGCCSSQENLRHTTARMVAEALWSKKEPSLTWEDIPKLIELTGKTLKAFVEAGRSDVSLQELYMGVLKTFNDNKK